MEYYLVGGAVRDQLLDIAVKDRDFVVIGETVPDMIKRGFKPVGKHFPVFLHPKSKEAYALARTEKKIGVGYQGFSFNTDRSVSLEDDLARRDLTINAMAMARDGALIDPFNGRRDLEQGVLRHVSPAFVEDPLRVLRVARFAARFDFKIAGETMDLMRQMVADSELHYLAPERVWLEMKKALSEGYPERFILDLHACHALKILFPEIARLFGVPQTEVYHPTMDAGLHTIRALRQAARLSDDPMVRFAVLVHDLGKGLTPAGKWPVHHGHEARTVQLIGQFCDRLRTPNQYRELAGLVARFHAVCHQLSHMHSPPTTLERLEVLDAFRRPDRLRQFLLACEAEMRGCAGFEAQPYPQADFLIAALALCRQVDTKAIASQGWTGRSFVEELRRQRLTYLGRLDSYDFNISQ